MNQSLFHKIFAINWREKIGLRAKYQPIMIVFAFHEKQGIEKCMPSPPPLSPLQEFSKYIHAVHMQAKYIMHALPLNAANKRWFLDDHK